ncbi:GNAT family N-acetyltransferase [Streptomyces orinoci]|uniref:GNAT family N-acetyltransferase n=1 Tax=Streptomyces orinoci TaxID=67339 RepID=A0ABV3JYK7_STRON|nr:GNAT family N-acetyltransferase [Streptomyces orinoci]
MKIEQTPWADPDASLLRSRQRVEIAEIYGTPDSEPGVPPSEADITVFLLARSDEGIPVGCGGLRELGGGVGEIKRMYVAPAWRGSGAAERILRALEDWARSSGWTALRLETGDRQPAAVRFYTRAGYRPIPNFGAYADIPASRCFERVL